MAIFRALPGHRYKVRPSHKTGDYGENRQSISSGSGWSNNVVFDFSQAVLSSDGVTPVNWNIVETNHNISIISTGTTAKKIKLLKKAITSYSINNCLKLAKIRLDFIAIDIDSKTKKIKVTHFPEIF